MILAMDIGNSHITVGCMDGTVKRHVCSLSVDPKRSKYEYAASLKQIWDFDGISPSAIEGAIIASVVPPLTVVLKAAIRRLCDVDAMVVGAGLKTGLNIKIDNPAQLGSDLAVGAVAAIERYQPPIIVADLGTATSFMAIDAQSRYLGGAICPGVGVSLSALVKATSQLPRVPVEAPRTAIGSNTVDAMKSGIVFGAAAMIDGFIDRFENELGGTAQVVATGTIAKVILPHCQRKIIYDEDLTLRGLSIIYQKNTRRGRAG